MRLRRLVVLILRHRFAVVIRIFSTYGLLQLVNNLRFVAKWPHGISRDLLTLSVKDDEFSMCAKF